MNAATHGCLTATATKSELIAALNEDFARECREVIAYAVFAERLAGTPTGREVAGRGEKAVVHSLVLGQLIADLGGRLAGGIDEDDALDRAADVADPDWLTATGYRLRERGEQLRSLGCVGYADRLSRLVEDKESVPDLCEILTA